MYSHTLFNCNNIKKSKICNNFWVIIHIFLQETKIIKTKRHISLQEKGKLKMKVSNYLVFVSFFVLNINNKVITTRPCRSLLHHLTLVGVLLPDPGTIWQ